VSLEAGAKLQLLFSSGKLFENFSLKNKSLILFSPIRDKSRFLLSKSIKERRVDAGAKLHPL
jgi:hypothetical protein